jgi:hypothetical protein
VNLHQGIGNNQQRSARFTCRPESTPLLPQASPSKGTTLSATIPPSPIAASRWCTVYVFIVLVASPAFTVKLQHVLPVWCIAGL